MARILPLLLLLLTCSCLRSFDVPVQHPCDCDRPTDLADDQFGVSEIYDYEGKLWSKNDAYRTQSGVGGYGIFWDGKDMDGKKADPGKYMAKVTYRPGGTGTSKIRVGCIEVLVSTQ